ncbi:MAG: EamA family transporter, partial [Candidatus Competibacterales bacterium]
SAEVGEPGFRGGEALLVLASVCWSWYTLQCQRWLVGFNTFHITAWTMTGALVAVWLLFAVMSQFSLAALPNPWPTWEINGLLLWLVLTSTCMGVVLWHGGTRRLGLVRSAMYFNLAPLFGVLISSALGFVPTLYQLAGGALVLVGVGQIHVRRYWALKYG